MDCRTLEVFIDFILHDSNNDNVSGSRYMCKIFLEIYSGKTNILRTKIFYYPFQVDFLLIPLSDNPYLKWILRDKERNSTNITSITNTSIFTCRRVMGEESRDSVLSSLGFSLSTMLCFSSPVTSPRTETAGPKLNK